MPVSQGEELATSCVCVCVCVCVPSRAFLLLLPQGTDQSFLEKLHHEMGSHRHFVKGEDKRKWAVQFGIQHYAGPVTYHVRNFLDKNKDVQQEIFFDFLEHSSCEFARDITKYRVSEGCNG